MSIVTKLRGLLYQKPGHVFEYASNGWDTVLEDRAGANAGAAAAAYEASWPRNVAGIRERWFLGDGSLVQHNVYITFGYVLSLAARGRSTLSVLDYGASTGHFYQLALELLATRDVTIRYSCYDVPSIVELGRRLNPDVAWLSTASDFDESYDLVMLSGVIQSIREWQKTLSCLARHCGDYLFIARTPVVEQSETFVCVRWLHGARTLRQVLNKSEFVKYVSSLGFTLIREFISDGPISVKDAPEPCVSKSWLFRRT